MQESWYYHVNGETHGPVDRHAIQSLLASGTLSGSDLVNRVGDDSWVRIDAMTNPPAPPSAGMRSRPAGVPASHHGEVIPVASDEPHLVPATAAPRGLIGKTAKDGVFTAEAHRIMSASTEQLAWQGAPSSWLALQGWWKVLGAYLLLKYFFPGWGFSAWGTLLLWAGILYALYRFVSLKRTTYRLTGQRLEVTSGAFSPVTERFNLYSLRGESKILYPFPFQLLGIGSLVIPHSSEPIVLQGIRNPRLVSDLLSTSSLPGAMGQVLDTRRGDFVR